VKVGEKMEGHHTIFRCAIKEELRNAQETYRLPQSLHRLKGAGLHSKIWQEERFAELYPRRGKKMGDVLKSMGREKWLSELGECYKWLEETWPNDYRGIYTCYEKAVKSIGGASGLID
jgi:hypothetical protein